MYYHYPYTRGSAYVLWKRLIEKKVGLKRIRMCQNLQVRVFIPYNLLCEVAKIGDLALAMFLGNLLTEKRTVWFRQPIIYAAIYGHRNIIKWLHHNCNIGFSDDDYEYAIWYVTTMHGDSRMIKWLHNIGYPDPKKNE